MDDLRDKYNGGESQAREAFEELCAMAIALEVTRGCFPKFATGLNVRQNFSFVKDILVIGKEMARKCRKTAIYQSQILGNTL